MYDKILKQIKEKYNVINIDNIEYVPTKHNFAYANEIDTLDFVNTQLENLSDEEYNQHIEYMFESVLRRINEDTLKPFDWTYNFDYLYDEFKKIHDKYNKEY
jgi:hypothetical protein